MRFIGAGTEKISRVRESTLSGIVGPAEERKRGVLAVNLFPTDLQYQNYQEYLQQASQTSTPRRPLAVNPLLLGRFRQRSPPSGTGNCEIRGRNKVIIPLNPALQDDDDYYFS